MLAPGPGGTGGFPAPPAASTMTGGGLLGKVLAWGKGHGPRVGAAIGAAAVLVVGIAIANNRLSDDAGPLSSGVQGDPESFDVSWDTANLCSILSASEVESVLGAAAEDGSFYEAGSQYPIGYYEETLPTDGDACIWLAPGRGADLRLAVELVRPGEVESDADEQYAAALASDLLGPHTDADLAEGFCAVSPMNGGEILSCYSVASDVFISIDLRRMPPEFGLRDLTDDEVAAVEALVEPITRRAQSA